MKITKEQIKQIKQLKEKGKKQIEISKELEIPNSTVQYYFSDRQKEKTKERSKKRYKEKGDTRDKEHYKEYQRIYQNKRYNNLKLNTIVREEKNEK